MKIKAMYINAAMLDCIQVKQAKTGKEYDYMVC